MAASKYVATKASIATGTALKSLLEIATVATARATLIQWWVEFDGFAAAAPILVELCRGSATITGTGLTPVKYDDFAPTALTTAKHTASGEGTTTDVLETHFIPPTSGILVQYPLGREISVPVSSFLKLRVTAAATVNACVGFVWEE